MTVDALIESLRQEQVPVVVEFWAPWCAPCRMMAPALERAAQAHEGQVILRKINADENPDLVRGLKVMAIPTMVIYDRGEEVQRRVGAQSPQALEALFDRLAQGETQPVSLPKAGLDPVTRMLRLTSGLALILLGLWIGSWLLLAAGGLVAFWGWYDRCPIWQAVAPRLKALLPSGKNSQANQ